MIYHNPLKGLDCCGIQVPRSYYKLIQRLAYKHNTSTRIISTIIANAGIHYFRDMHSDEPDLLDNIIGNYEWYEDHKNCPINKKDIANWKNVKRAFDIK